eukprot:3398080-Rhodomonas_salina.2
MPGTRNSPNIARVILTRRVCPPRHLPIGKRVGRGVGQHHARLQHPRTVSASASAPTRQRICAQNLNALDALRKHPIAQKSSTSCINVPDTHSASYLRSNEKTQSL